MSNFARKIQRNKIKNALKNSKQKRTMPLSKYRFKTDEEMQKEAAEMMTEQMLQNMKNSK